MGAGGAVMATPAFSLPSALDVASRIEADAKSKQQQLVFFLDYDGTLSPIVDKPDDARLPEDTRAVLADLKARFPTAIVTGRALNKVKSFIQVDGLMYAASHGFDIDAPPLEEFCVAEQHLPALQGVFRALRSTVEATPGASLEDNRFSVSVHYRLVEDEQAVAVLQRKVEDVTKNSGLRLHHGKMVWEIRPPTNWNKGKAVEYILRELKMNTSRFLPIYVGDDITDEDAFRSLKTCNGLGVIVFDADKPGNLAKPRETHAGMRLSNPSEVRDFLASFVRSKQLESEVSAAAGSSDSK